MPGGQLHAGTAGDLANCCGWTRRQCRMQIRLDARRGGRGCPHLLGLRPAMTPILRSCRLTCGTVAPGGCGGGRGCRQAGKRVWPRRRALAAWARRPRPSRWSCPAAACTHSSRGCLPWLLSIPLPSPQPRGRNGRHGSGGPRTSHAGAPPGARLHGGHGGSAGGGSSDSTACSSGGGGGTRAPGRAGGRRPADRPHLLRGDGAAGLASAGPSHHADLAQVPLHLQEATRGSGEKGERMSKG